MNPIKQYIEERERLFRELFISHNNADQECWSILGMNKNNVESFNRQTAEGLVKVVREIVDGYKEVYKITGKEKEHMDSCCNETIDDITHSLTLK